MRGKEGSGRNSSGGRRGGGRGREGVSQREGGKTEVEGRERFRGEALGGTGNGRVRLQRKKATEEGGEWHGKE